MARAGEAQGPAALTRDGFDAATRDLSPALYTVRGLVVPRSTACRGHACPPSNRAS